MRNAARRKALVGSRAESRPIIIRIEERAGRYQNMLFFINRGGRGGGVR
jgi:hypothetical protein